MARECARGGYGEDKLHHLIDVHIRSAQCCTQADCLKWSGTKSESNCQTLSHGIERSWWARVIPRTTR